MVRPGLVIAPRQLSLPIDAVTATMVVYGGKGMGKTNLLAVILEEMSKQRLRWCSIDPVGVHWGLRHAADGKGDGVPCLRLGGVHGDIAIYPDSGEIVADLVADNDVNVIIDCSRNKHGQMWSIGERTRFITAFALRLFQRQGSLVDGRRREPIFLALDEAARYIPQTIPHGNPDLAASLGAWEQLVEEGRNVGIGVGLFTQRSARINKSVAELADTMMAFRTTGPNSITAIIDWLGEHVAKVEQRGYVGQVRKLPVGTALVVSPGWLEFEGVVGMRARETFDSSATPKPGERARRVSGDGATVDLDLYVARMAETVERAKADDPKELRKQIAALHLEVEALTRKAAAVAPAAPAVEVPVWTKADHDALRLVGEQLMPIHEVMTSLHETMTGLSNSIIGVSEQVTSTMQAATDSLHGSLNGRSERRAQIEPVPVRAEAPTVQPVEHRVSPAGTEVSLSVGARGLLEALARRHPMRLSRTQLATFAHRSLRSSSFRPHIQELIDARLASWTDGLLGLTPGGVEMSGAESMQPQDIEEVRAVWRQALPPTAGRMLDALIKAWPDEMDRDDLTRAAGVSPTSSGVGSAIRILRANGLVLPDVLRVTDDIGRPDQ